MKVLVDQVRREKYCTTGRVSSTYTHLETTYLITYSLLILDPSQLWWSITVWTGLLYLGDWRFSHETLGVYSTIFQTWLETEILTRDFLQSTFPVVSHTIPSTQLSLRLSSVIDHKTSVIRCKPEYYVSFNNSFCNRLGLKISVTVNISLCILICFSKKIASLKNSRQCGKYGFIDKNVKIIMY